MSQGHRRDSLSKIFEVEESNEGNAWMRNTLSIIGVIGVGIAGWVLAWQSGVWKPTPEGSNPEVSSDTPVGASILGYFSAVCYLGYVLTLCSTYNRASPYHLIFNHMTQPLLPSPTNEHPRARIPQIIKNYRDKSCEGLALLFFLLSLMGNATYGLGILCHSLERDYLITNTPWLIGSLGTMVEDAIIFVQFRMYAPKPSASTEAVE
jgi:uncharacterized protein with PQ loop repeat